MTFTLIENLGYRINNKSGGSALTSEASLMTYNTNGWFPSPTKDVAARLLFWGPEADIKAMPFTAFLRETQVEAGTPVFILGFPLGLRSEKYALPILRRGVVARRDEQGFILDGFVFPGNSGGPVVYEPLFAMNAGPGISVTSSLLQGTWLVGLVVSEISYIETAVSPQTKRPRITFEDNTGLCHILSADAILEVLKSPEFEMVDREN